MIGTDPSGMNIWVTLPGKEQRPVEVLADSGVNTDWVVEDGSHKYQKRPVIEIRNVIGMSISVIFC